MVENRRTKLCLECKTNKSRERCKDYKKRNKEKVKAYNKEYKANNKEMVKEYNKEYNIANREAIQKQQTIRKKERKKTDMSYKICEDLRKKFINYFKTNSDNKKSIMSKIVGCSSNKFKKWIESNFDDKMTWENYNEYWQIDHIICCRYFNFELEDHQKLCFNWKNTRPLNKMLNLAREDIVLEDILNHEKIINNFLENNKKGYDDIDFDFEYLITELSEKFD